VSDANIAYHAGESKMPDGRTGVNNFSLGVEMLTTKKDKLTQEQYASLKFLIANIKEKYKITAVLGHNQIAPGRKDDPWNFEWVKLN
jgi:AmpD protein